MVDELNEVNITSDREKCNGSTIWYALLKSLHFRKSTVKCEKEETNM